VSLEPVFCRFDLLLGVFVFLLLLACEFLLSSLVLNHLVWLRWRHLHNTCASVNCYSFPVIHDSSGMMHQENNILEKKLCCQQRKNHAQAQAPTALRGISENGEFSNIPARKGTLGAFSMAPLFRVLATPNPKARAQGSTNAPFPLNDLSLPSTTSAPHYN
jgi:hypothetical protein